MRSIAWWPTLMVLSIAVYTDLSSRRVPNWLVLPFLISGLAVSGWVYGWHGIFQSLGGLGMGAVLFGMLFYMGGMGMGDVKLCAAIGVWIGPGQLFTAIVLTGLAGGVMALCWALWGGFVGELFTGSSDLVFGLKERRMRLHPDLVLTNPHARKMPYAPAIAIGTLISFFPR